MTAWLVDNGVLVAALLLAVGAVLAAGYERRRQERPVVGYARPGFEQLPEGHLSPLIGPDRFWVLIRPAGWQAAELARGSWHGREVVQFRLTRPDGIGRGQHQSATLIRDAGALPAFQQPASLDCVDSGLLLGYMGPRLLARVNASRNETPGGRMDMLGLPAWLWWVIIAVVLVLVDLALLGGQFILVAAALAALVTAMASVLGLSLAGQLWTFLIALLVLTPILVYWLRPRLRGNGAGPLESGWAGGARVTVEARGEQRIARLKGDEFPVTLMDDGQPEVGEQLIVDHMDGITLKAHRPPSRENEH